MFVLLVVSTVITFSTVITSASKHFLVLLTAHTTLGQQMILLTSAMLAAHTSQGKWICVTFFICFLMLATIPSPPLDLPGQRNALQGCPRTMT